MSSGDQDDRRASRWSDFTDEELAIFETWTDHEIVGVDGERQGMLADEIRAELERRRT